MPITQASLNLLFREGLRKNFRDDWKEHPPQWNQILKQGTIDGPEISATIFTAFSRLREMGDGDAVDFDYVKQGPKVSAVDREFGIGCSITPKTFEDDKYGKVKQSGKWLSHATRMTYEYLAAGFLDNAFTGSTIYLGIDGLTICNASHTFLNAPGTWSNVTANPVGFSMAGVNAILDLFLNVKDHNGDPIVMSPDKWIIGNNIGDLNRWAMIFGSEQDPFTANNAINPVRERFNGKAPTKVVSVYKTAPRSYFAADTSYFDAHFLIRRAATMEDWRDPPTGNRNAKVTTRVLIWFVDPRGFAGSNPT